jgi:hypothetical protein
VVGSSNLLGPSFFVGALRQKKPGKIHNGPSMMVRINTYSVVSFDAIEWHLKRVDKGPDPYVVIASGPAFLLALCAKKNLGKSIMDHL